MNVAGVSTVYVCSNARTTGWAISTVSSPIGKQVPLCALSTFSLSPQGQAARGFISADPNLVLIALGKMSAGSVHDPSSGTFATTFMTRCALPPKWTTSPTVRPVLVVYPHLHSAVPNAVEHIVTDGTLVLMSVAVSRSSELPSYSLSMPVAGPTLFAGVSVSYRSLNGSSGTSITTLQSHASGKDGCVFTPCYFSGSSFGTLDLFALQTFGVGLTPYRTGLQTRPTPVPLRTPIVGAVLSVLLFQFVGRLARG